MHLIIRDPAPSVTDPVDPIAAHRELQRQLQAGELSPREYEAAFRTLDAAASRRELCDNGDGRLATVILNGRRYCSACWLAARRPRT